METDLVVESAVIDIKDDLLGNKLIAFASARDKNTDAKKSSQSTHSFCQNIRCLRR